jgi:hypothetical protein
VFRFVSELRFCGFVSEKSSFKYADKTMRDRCKTDKILSVASILYFICFFFLRIGKGRHYSISLAEQVSLEALCRTTGAKRRV